MTDIAEQIKSAQSDTAELQTKFNNLSFEYQKTLTSLDDKRMKLATVNKFIQCATALFFGYVDGATTIAENSGSGGPTSNSPWGRDEDEDDRRFMMRCLAQASQMMRPRAGKSVKRK
jgi:hypothetical protein